MTNPTDNIEQRARELLALGLDEYGHHGEAESVRRGEDLDMYETELWSIAAALRSVETADEPVALPMATAPRDGRMLRLLVRFTEHATEDAEVAWTIGANQFDNNGEDVWQFAGWCWTHDHFTEGKGEPIGWLPFHAQPAAPITVTDEDVFPADASDEMADSVRYLLIAIQQPGRTFESVRKHCELSGMDVSHWPEWTRGHDREHFAKAACAALIWHCMRHTALESFAKRKAGME